MKITQDFFLQFRTWLQLLSDNRRIMRLFENRKLLNK